jgi:hypothetical protein
MPRLAPISGPIASIAISTTSSPCRDELTREIIAALRLKLTPEQSQRLGRKGDIDIEAYNLLLRGRERMLLHTRGGNAEARGLLDGALKRQPDFFRRAGLHRLHPGQ